MSQPSHAVLAVTQVSQTSPEIAIVFSNTSSESVTIDQVGIDRDSVSAERFTELEVTTPGSNGMVMMSGVPVVVKLRFRPTKAGPIRAKVRFHGHSASGDAHSSCDIVGESVKLGSEQADQHELELGKYQAGRIEDTHDVPTTSTFVEMLSSVLAADASTNANGDAGRTRAQQLLRPVSARLIELASDSRKLERFGAGNIAGKQVFDSAKSAVDSWIRLLQLGSTIETAPLVTRFRAGAEAIHILTGERQEAHGLDGFDSATKVVGIGATGMLTAPAVAALVGSAIAPVVINEAALLGASVKMGAGAVAAWATANPVAALAATEILIGFGIQIGEGGLDTFIDTLRDPRGALFVLMQVTMDIMHVASGMEGPRGPRVRPASGDDASPQPTKPGAETTTISEIEQRSQEIRVSIKSIGEQAGADAKNGTGKGSPSATSGESVDSHAKAPQTASSATTTTPDAASVTPSSTGSTINPDQIIENPTSVWGKSASDVAKAFDDAGFKATVRQSTRGSGLAQIVVIEGHPKITQIQIHPGGGRHGGTYVKISTSTNGTVKVVDPASYKPTPGEKATIVNAPGG